MADYRITAYENGTQKTIIITAYSREDAFQTAWALFDADDMYVEEVIENGSSKEL